MKILLAIDDSNFSERAVQAVVKHVRPQDTKVQVLHIFEPIGNLPVYSSYALAREIETLEQESLSRAEKVVKRAAEILRTANFDVMVRVEKGEPKRLILEAAAAWKADLIVVGSHGRSGVDRFFLGSVSEVVARHAPCSVEIVRGASPDDQLTDEQTVSEYAKKCGHPPCTCIAKCGKYCSAQCEALETMPDIDCRCGHPECAGRAH